MTGLSSANTSGVSLYDSPAPSAYDEAQFQSLINKLNELIMALRR